MAVRYVNFETKIPSVANLREHWAVKAKRTKEHRAKGFLATKACCASLQSFGLPVVVTLTRFSSRKLDDDNLCSAFKAIRDGIADALGVKDNSSKVIWEYKQSYSKTHGFSVEFEDFRP